MRIVSYPNYLAIWLHEKYNHKMNKLNYNIIYSIDVCDTITNYVHTMSVPIASSYSYCLQSEVAELVISEPAY